MDKIFSLILCGGTLIFLKELIAKGLWSMILYFFRGELNHDNNEDTPDKYLHFNPSTGKFSERYVFRYTLKGVYWGFFYEKKFVQKLSFWSDWADDRENRFPWPININTDDEQSIVNLIKRRR